VNSCEKTNSTCVSEMTLYSSVFASPSLVKVAHEMGLDCTSEAYRRAAGKHADIATLAVVHEVVMEYTALTLLAAAKDIVSLQKCSNSRIKAALGLRCCSIMLLVEDTLSCSAGAVSTAVLGCLHLGHYCAQLWRAMLR
jgi:hypothetical protein